MSEPVTVDLDLDLSPFTLYLNERPKGGLPAEVVVRAGTNELELRHGREVVSRWTVETPARVSQQVVLPLESGSLTGAKKASRLAGMVPDVLGGAGKTVLLTLASFALFSAVPAFSVNPMALLWLLSLPVIGVAVHGILGKRRWGMKLWALCSGLSLVAAFIMDGRFVVLMILCLTYVTVYVYNKERGDWT